MTTKTFDSTVSVSDQELSDASASSAIKLFANPQFRVRVIMRCADPWFVAKDACDCLGVSNSRDAVARLDDDEKDVGKADTLGGSQDMVLISESGLYTLIMRSNKPEAKVFRKWVTSEVLPSIRKTGSYGMSQISRKDQLFLAIIHSESEEERADALKELAEINKYEVKALTAERDEAIRTKTQYQSNLAAQMSGRVGGLTTALNRVRLENDRLKGDRFTKEDVYIIMDTQGVSFTLKTVKDVIRESLNTISKYLKEPFPKIPTGERTDPNGKTFEVKSFVYTRKTVQAFFEYVENNPMEWQARHRKSILSEWLNHHMTIPA